MSSFQHEVLWRPSHPVTDVTRWLEDHCVEAWAVEHEDPPVPTDNPRCLRVLFASNGDRLSFIRHFA